MDVLTEAIHKEIRATAQNKDTITYGELAEAVGLNTGRDRRLHNALDAINRQEHAQCRPLLSAVVVLADKGISSDGFFPLAEELGRFDPSEQTRHDYWEWELEEVHRYWTGRLRSVLSFLSESRPLTYNRFIGFQLASTAPFLLGLLLLVWWSQQDAFLALIGVTALLQGYAFWPSKLSLLDFGQKICEPILLIFMLLATAAVVIGAGHLIGLDPLAGFGGILHNLFGGGE